MFTTIDERKGLVKTNWNSIRNRAVKVAPEFVKIVDELSPDDSFPLYLAYYIHMVTLKGTLSVPFYLDLMATTIVYQIMRSQKTLELIWGMGAPALLLECY